MKEYCRADKSHALDLEVVNWRHLKNKCWDKVTKNTESSTVYYSWRPVQVVKLWKDTLKRYSQIYNGICLRGERNGIRETKVRTFKFISDVLLFFSLSPYLLSKKEKPQTLTHNIILWLGLHKCFTQIWQLVLSRKRIRLFLHQGHQSPQRFSQALFCSISNLRDSVG